MRCHELPRPPATRCLTYVRSSTASDEPGSTSHHWISCCLLSVSGFRLRITTAALVEVMSNCPQITELSLAGAHQIEPSQAIGALVFGEDGGAFGGGGGSVLRSGPPIRVLSCNGWPLDTQSLCTLLEQPAAAGALERLHLGGCGGATDVSMLMLALNCPSLTSLVLSGAHISDTGLQVRKRIFCAVLY